MLQRLIAFLKFYFRAGTKYNVQSPFLHNFIINVLDGEKMYYAYSRLEKERKIMLADPSIIEVEDHGAGSFTGAKRQRSIGSIATSAVSRPDKCQRIFRLVNYFQSENTLELGTSLGLSSAYMAWANLNGHVTTCEGSPSIAAYAHVLHERVRISNINIVQGPFASTLEKVLNSQGPFDLVFIDGHHDEQATIAYFDTILPAATKNCVFIIDDIYWSDGMTNAWAYIKKHPKSRLSLDLFDIGIVFMDESLSKEDITYIPYKYKPWNIGLFGN